MARDAGLKVHLSVLQNRLTETGDFAELKETLGSLHLKADEKHVAALKNTFDAPMNYEACEALYQIKGYSWEWGQKNLWHVYQWAKQNAQQLLVTAAIVAVPTFYLYGKNMVTKRQLGLHIASLNAKLGQPGEEREAAEQRSIIAQLSALTAHVGAMQGESAALATRVNEIAGKVGALEAGLQETSSVLAEAKAFLVGPTEGWQALMSEKMLK